MIHPLPAHLTFSRPPLCPALWPRSLTSFCASSTPGSLPTIWALALALPSARKALFPQMFTCLAPLYHMGVSLNLFPQKGFPWLHWSCLPHKQSCSLTLWHFISFFVLSVLLNYFIIIYYYIACPLVECKLFKRKNNCPVPCHVYKYLLNECIEWVNEEEFHDGQERLRALLLTSFGKGDGYDWTDIMARRHFMCEEWSILISTVWRSKIICSVRAFLSIQMNCREGTTWKVDVKEAGSMDFRMLRK